MKQLCEQKRQEFCVRMRLNYQYLGSLLTQRRRD